MIEVEITQNEKKSCFKIDLCRLHDPCKSYTARVTHGMNLKFGLQNYTTRVVITRPVLHFLHDRVKCYTTRVNHGMQLSFSLQAYTTRVIFTRPV